MRGRGYLLVNMCELLCLASVVVRLCAVRMHKFHISFKPITEICRTFAFSIFRKGAARGMAKEHDHGPSS